MKHELKIKLYYSCILFLASCFVFLFFPLTDAFADERSSFKVRRVIDGDTIELETGEHVRYIGIDTPETRQRKGDRWMYKPQAFAEEAKKLNEHLVMNHLVRLEFDVQKRDRYRRLLAYVYQGDLFVNLEMIRRGYARLLTIPPNVRHADEFRKALQQARKNKKGIWDL